MNRRPHRRRRGGVSSRLDRGGVSSRDRGGVSRLDRGGVRSPNPRRWASFAGALAVAVVAGGCSHSTTPAPSVTDTNGSPPGTSSTTTTTTLPVPVPVPGSLIKGADGFLGQASWVPVAAVPDGASTAPLPTPGTSGYLRIDRIAFRRFGSGPDLLLVAGEDCSMASWPPLFLALLAQHDRVTIFDLPGTGYSGPVGGALSLDRWADETAGLIEALRLTHPTVLGWGLGGEVALALAERHAGSLASLVLVDTSAGGRASTPPSGAAEHIVSSPTVTTTELARLFFSSRFAAAEQAWLQGTEATVPDDLTQSAIEAEGRLQSLLWTSGALASADGSIRVPALVVSGSNDVLFPAPDGSLLGSSIIGAKSIVYEGADYASMMELTTKFVRALESFTG